MVYLFLDTNSLLEFQQFESINWSNICGSSNYTIVIAPIVIREINKWKDTGKGKKRERARKVRKRLNEIAKKINPPSLNVSFCKDPKQKTFSNPQFNKENNDDWLIFAALDFECGDNDEKIIITNDTGIFLIAQEFNIKVLEIPEDKYLLPQEPTDEEKEIKRLKAELENLNSRCSEPFLSFIDGSTEIYVEASDIPNFSEKIVLYRDKLIEDNPYKEHLDNNFQTKFSGLDLSIWKTKVLPNLEFLPTDSDIDNFNDDVDRFIEESIELYRQKLLSDFIDGTIQKLQIIVGNKGSSKTGTLMIQLCFPQDLTLLCDDSFGDIDFTPPNPPKLMTQEKRKLAKLLDQQTIINQAVNRSLYGVSSYNVYSDRSFEEHWDLTYQVPNKEELYIEIPYVIQGTQCLVNQKMNWYITATNKGTHIVKWRIIDESLPKPIDGELKIIIA